MRAEIDGAAALGAELFVLDAGWYAGTGRNGAGDFTSGLGSWQVDRARFPSGLRALRDYAHDRGMKFGIWVEPERVAQSTVGPARPRAGDVARQERTANSDRSTPRRFASAAARSGSGCSIG